MRRGGEGARGGAGGSVAEGSHFVADLGELGLEEGGGGCEGLLLALEALAEFLGGLHAEFLG